MKAKVGQKGSSLFFYIPAEISKELDIHKGDSVDVNIVAGRGVFNKSMEKKQSVTLTLSFEEAQSLSHTVCGSHIYVEGFENVYLVTYEGDASIDYVTEGSDEGCSMHFCSRRLEAIMIRDALIGNGYRATMIHNEIKAFEEPEDEEFVVLTNYPFTV